MSFRKHINWIKLGDVLRYQFCCTISCVGYVFPGLIDVHYYLSPVAAIIWGKVDNESVYCTGQRTFY